MAEVADRTAAERTPAQLYALLFGVTLLLAGILGFFADSSFETGSGIQGDDLIIFEVNGIHNIVHIASGLLGLALASSVAGARAYALGFGAVYLLVTIIGFIDGEDVLGLIPVNTADNFLHLAIALTGIAAGLVSPRETGVRDGRRPPADDLSKDPAYSPTGPEGGYKGG